MKTAATLREIPCDQHVTRHRMVQIAYNNQGAASLTVPGKTLKHIDRFLRRRCALDLLPLYPNSKEISESEACRYAAVKKLGFDRTTKERRRWSSGTARARERGRCWPTRRNGACGASIRW